MTDLTQAPDQTAAAEAIGHWLREFNAALARRTPMPRPSCSATDSYWRDLVAFTWNIKTVEGRDEIADMLDGHPGARRGRGLHARRGTRPSADGVIEAWIEFETAVGPRARASAAAGDGSGWTLLTTLHELKGHEEPRARTADGRRARRRPATPRRGRSVASGRRASWATRRSRTC